MPSDVPTCKKNLFHWISSTVDELNKDMAGVRQCWASTGLLQAWERSVQVEAAGKLAQLFPNMFPKEQFDGSTRPTPGSTLSQPPQRTMSLGPRMSRQDMLVYPSHRWRMRRSG